MNLMGLSPGKTYYVRAYAVNSVGVGYGNEVEITLSLGGETPPEIIREPEKPEVKTEVNGCRRLHTERQYATQQQEEQGSQERVGVEGGEEVEHRLIMP